MPPQQKPAVDKPKHANHKQKREISRKNIEEDINAKIQKTS
jgi:hypothetical protein